MKKYLKIFFILIYIIILLMPIVKADSTDTFEIQLKVTENKEKKNFELYMLLPQEYIEYAIDKAGLEIEYNGAETLKQNEIPLINVDATKIQDDTYNQDGIEYVQILLEPNEKNVYVFDIISDYAKMNMKLRIKNDDKDYIMHIDNFKVDNNVCEIEYNYDEDKISQPTKIVINFKSLLLIIILIVVLIIAYKYKTKSNK